MKGILKVGVLMGCLCVVDQSFAADCKYSEVTAVQSQSGNVLIQVKVDDNNFPWRNLGSHDAKYVDSYQSLAQQALATGQQVMLRFNGGAGCSETDYSAVPVAFRLYQ